jgi:UPF0489 domain
LDVHKVLDLDLDFFVWPIVRDVAESEDRPNPADYMVQTEAQVREFIEQRCGLSCSAPLIGRFVEHHVGAFAAWREWQDRGLLNAPFQVVHVDAHSDLGSGLCNDSPRFIETELLSMPLLKRATPRFGVDATNSGNYLLVAIANRWLSALKYVHPVDPNPAPLTDFMKVAEKLREFRARRDESAFEVNDLPSFVFLDGKPESKTIQLCRFDPERYESFDSEPTGREPPIPFDAVPAPQFSDSGFTHLIIAKSPAFAPETADHLLGVVRKYFQDQ